MAGNNSNKWKVLVADPLAEPGIELLRRHAEVDVRLRMRPAELKERIGEYDALIVRSETKVTREIIAAARRLQVIGRAGVGVDNVDLDAATERGIVVVNAPESITVSTAEHTIALILALARRIPDAHATLRQGIWQREPFLGAELRRKTLGIIGVGRVGSEVARRMRAFEMRLLGYDPLVAPDYFRLLGVEPVGLEQLLRESDFVTIHIPLTPTNRGFIGAKELALMKPTAYLINAARGGIVDERALVEAVREGRLAGAALDVFEQEPLTESPLLTTPGIVVTPHLGASTVEAQAQVAVDVAQQVLAVLQGQPAQYAVNAPLISPEVYPLIRPYIEVGTWVGKLAARLAEGQPRQLEIVYEGEIAGYTTAPLKAGVLGGLLAEVSEERVTWVNADLVASKRGLRIVERHMTAERENYQTLLTAVLMTTAGTHTVSGTWLRAEPHIVRLEEWWLDVVPTPGTYWMLIRHRDQPGMIGRVGTILGNADINISFMEVSRESPRGNAFMVLGLDDPVPDELMEVIRAVPGITWAKVVAL